MKILSKVLLCSVLLGSSLSFSSDSDILKEAQTNLSTHVMDPNQQKHVMGLLEYCLTNGKQLKELEKPEIYKDRAGKYNRYDNVGIATDLASAETGLQALIADVVSKSSGGGGSLTFVKTDLENLIGKISGTNLQPFYVSIFDTSLPFAERVKDFGAELDAGQSKNSILNLSKIIFDDALSKAVLDELNAKCSANANLKKKSSAIEVANSTQAFADVLAAKAGATIS